MAAGSCLVSRDPVCYRCSVRPGLAIVILSAITTALAADDDKRHQDRVQHPTSSSKASSSQEHKPNIISSTLDINQWLAQQEQQEEQEEIHEEQRADREHSNEADRMQSKQAGASSASDKAAAKEKADANEAKKVSKSGDQEASKRADEKESKEARAKDNTDKEADDKKTDGKDSKKEGKKADTEESKKVDKTESKDKGASGVSDKDAHDKKTDGKDSKKEGKKADTKDSKEGPDDVTDQAGKDKTHDVKDSKGSDSVFTDRDDFKKASEKDSQEDGAAHVEDSKKADERKSKLVSAAPLISAALNKHAKGKEDVADIMDSQKADESESKEDGATHVEDKATQGKKADGKEPKEGGPVADKQGSTKAEERERKKDGAADEESTSPGLKQTQKIVKKLEEQVEQLQPRHEKKSPTSIEKTQHTVADLEEQVSNLKKSSALAADLKEQVERLKKNSAQQETKVSPVEKQTQEAVTALQNEVLKVQQSLSDIAGSRPQKVSAPYQCTQKFPICFHDGDCVSTSCAHGCPWKPGENYIHGYDKKGSKCKHDYQVRIACVGDSITWGAKASSYNHSYPWQLQEILGEHYHVMNFGQPGGTVLVSRHDPSTYRLPYSSTEAFKNAIISLPDLVILMLGTNDATKYTWPDQSKSFASAYDWIIRVFRNLASQPKIYLVVPPPVYKEGDELPQVVNQVLPDRIREIAKENGLDDPIDVHATFKAACPDLHENKCELMWSPDGSHALGDGVHPNDAGYLQIAKTVAAVIQPSTGSEPRPNDLVLL